MTSAVFVDTSALVAILDAGDEFHEDAARIFHDLLDGVQRGRKRLVTHSGITVECTAVVARRLGMPAVRRLHDDLLSLTEVHRVRANLQERAIAAMFAAGRRRPSLTDWISFEVMRQHRIRFVFTFDRDFVRQGFRQV